MRRYAMLTKLYSGAAIRRTVKAIARARGMTSRLACAEAGLAVDKLNSSEFNPRFQTLVALLATLEKVRPLDEGERAQVLAAIGIGVGVDGVQGGNLTN